MRLLLLCPHFTPDLHAATGEVMTKLVEALARRNHQITVVTSLPWYQHHDVDPAWRGRPWRVERTAWGRVVRVWPFPTDKTNIAARAVGFGGLTSLVTAAALTQGRHDVVLGMSPPPFLGDAAWIAARRWRAPMVFNTQDIFPDVAIDLGALSNRRMVELAKRHERSLYRRADAVTVLSRDQADNVAAKLPADQRDKVVIIHNFVDLDRIEVVERENGYRRRHQLTGKTVVMYSGNVGLSQSFDLVRAAAVAWRHRPDVQFVINGEGAARPEVDRWAAELPNVTVADFAPRAEVSDVLGAADVHLILLKRGLARSSTPSKLYANLASGRAILASIDEGSEVATTMARAGAGLAVPPEAPDAFLSALASLLDDPVQRELMGKRGRSYVEEWLTPDQQAVRYEQVFERLVAGDPIDPSDPDRALQ
ncbi:MAG: glycosyltransferase family 4 protein [Acidimicrobiia bacterium]|nr:glycosyltransferase family 4 protein [Acidimicrobiia bacterium]